jgi:hypothetical protein
MSEAKDSKSSSSKTSAIQIKRELTKKYNVALRHMFGPEACKFLPQSADEKEIKVDPVMVYALKFLSNAAPAHMTGDYEKKEWVKVPDYKISDFYKRIEKLYPHPRGMMRSDPNSEPLYPRVTLMPLTSSVKTEQYWLKLLANGYAYLRYLLDRFYDMEMTESWHIMSEENNEVAYALQDELDRQTKPRPWQCFHVFLRRVVEPIYQLAKNYSYTKEQLTDLLKTYVFMPAPKCQECNYAGVDERSPAKRYTRCRICMQTVCAKDRQRSDFYSYGETVTGIPYEKLETVKCLERHMAKHK